MLLTVNGYERDARPKLFDAMFRQRKTVFYDQKGWDVKVTDTHYEIDEFDRDDTVYLCSIGDRGELLGSVRLLNTVTDHMASNIFGEIFKGIEVRSPNIWEVTRFSVVADPRVQPNGVSQAACELMLGTLSFSLEYGVSQITAIYEAPVGRICRRCGLNYKVLGSAKMDPNPTIYFAISDISQYLELSARSATGLFLDQDEDDARAA